MSKNVDEFLEAMKSKTNSEVAEIHKTAGPSINAIKTRTKGKIANLESDEDSIGLSQEVIYSFQKRISKKQIEWLKRTNNEKGRLLDQLIMKLENQFKSLESGPEFYDTLAKLFLEVKQEVGSSYEVHIPKNSDPEKFKSVSSVNQNVVADLNEVGVLVRRLDIPISVENTLESRFTKNRDELIIEAYQGLWNDIEDSPWQFKQILSHLMSKE
ncbi:MAG: hypothetical protein ACTSSO_01285 [Candidatus Hodarchaeales archaeon]